MSILNSFIKTIGSMIFKIGGNIEDFEQFYTPEELRKQREIPFKANRRGYDFAWKKISGVDVLRIKRKHTKSDKLLISIHGGGFVGGCAEFNSWMIKSLVKKTFFRALSIEYRLAPEHPFPAGLMDCFNVYKEMLKQYGPQNIYIGGESAGGNLTMALLLKLKDEGIPLPKAAFVSSPCLDQTYSLISHYENEVIDVLLSLGDMKKFTYNYTANSPGIDLKHPYVSPLFGDFTGLPPILIFSSHDEFLVDDSRVLYRKLKDAGVKTEYYEYDNTFHAFTVFGTITKEGSDSILKIVEFLKNTKTIENTLFIRLEKAYTVYEKGGRWNGKTVLLL